MSLLENAGGLSAADVAAVTGNNNGMFGGDGAWWLLILLLFGLGGRWGNNAGGNGGGYAMQADVQRQFDQSALMNSQNGILQSINSLAMSMQNCCCENRQQTADVKYTVATEAAATRANCDANSQKVFDKLCQLEMDGIKQNYENRISGMQNQIDSLRLALNTANFNASQNDQTARLMADNALQTTAIEQYLNPTPRPAYVVQNPNCCQNNFGGCGYMG